MDEEYGWIKLHRKFLSWEWYGDANTKAVFLHLLLTANTKQNRWRGNLIDTGETIISVNALSEELHLSTKQVRTALEHLKSTGEVANRKANGAASGVSIWKVCNYCIYQEFGFTKGQAVGQENGTQNGKDGASEGQAKGKQRATLKEYKNNKNKRIEENNILGDSDENLFEKLWELYPRKMGKASVSKKAKQEVAKIGFERMAEAIQKYKRQIDREGTKEEYIMYGSTFFNTRYADFLEPEKPIAMEKQKEKPPEKEERELTDDEWAAL